MSLDALLSSGKKAIGIKQTKKALEHNLVERLFVARDAEEHVVRPVMDMSQQQKIDVVFVDSMGQLGKACGIAVGASVAAILHS